MMNIFDLFFSDEEKRPKSVGGYTINYNSPFFEPCPDCGGKTFQTLEAKDIYSILHTMPSFAICVQLSYENMGFLSTLVNVASLFLFLRKRDYVEESELWFDDVWKHIKKPANGEGELVAKGGRIYRQLRISFDDDISVLVIDEEDEGALIDDIKLGWWKKLELDYSGIVTIKELWK